jgi:16S rRNA processing protein RimM
MTTAELTLTSEEWVWLARIRRTQGRKGEVFAEILTDFPEKFSDRRRLWLISEPSVQSSRGSAARPVLSLPREVELTSHWLHKGGIVLHFAGVDSISAAEELAGLIVALPYEQRAPLAEGETYISDLIGCTLFDYGRAEASDSVPVGEIVDVDRTAGPAALLVVRGSKGEILIPFAQSYLRHIDLNARRIEMTLPAGLVDLNVPEKP